MNIQASNIGALHVGPKIKNGDFLKNGCNELD
jgi:hypothetical protein